MNYQLIATLGPKSNTPKIWGEMLSAGATSFRLNTSHLSLDSLSSWLDELDDFFAHRQTQPALILDLQGSKWRLGKFEAFDLVAGQEISLVFGESANDLFYLPVPHLDFFSAAALSNGEIILNDAKIRLKMDGFKSNFIHARIIQGGMIASHKGITFAHSEFRKEGLNEKDLAIIEQTHRLPFIQYALSYVKDAVEMENFRKQIGARLPLIAKLERQPAVDEADKIALFVEAVWLCRGDLGAELGLKSMAETVHEFSKRVRSLPVPAVLAGQLLEHMTEHQIPTRSELCYLHDALVNGYNGVVLSDETAIGLDPVGAVRAAAMFQE